MSEFQKFSLEQAINQMGLVEVQLKNGTQERVEVREVKFSRAQELIMSRMNPAKFIGVVTGKDEKWVDSLTTKSAFALMDECERANLELLGQMEERLIRLAGK